MKNIFKFMGIALIASSIMVACNPDPEDEVVKYTITATVNDATMGTVEGAGEFEEGATCTLTAIPNEGYMFVNWNDAVTDNPRTITVTGNLNYMANFAEIPFEGAEVTFDGTVWTPTLVGAGMASNRFITILFENYDAGNDSRTVYIQGGQATGTFTNEGENPAYYWFYNHLKERCTIQGSEYPTWMAEDFTQVITAIDMNAKTTEFTANGSVYNADEYYNNGQNEVVKDLSVRVNTEWTTLNFSKGTLNTLVR